MSSDQLKPKKRKVETMETSQQFHLKWNNHSLNTLSSFQHLLDTNTLVDVSLTASNGKTVTAHRMVLAACSEYFYRLFKDLPEKHPVIVFKDAAEEIVRDLLLFMYKGEVEVQESHLNDFLKFADTLQVKGLSQSDREDLSARQQQDAAAAAAAATAAAAAAAAGAPATAGLLAAAAQQQQQPIKLDASAGVTAASPVKINGPPPGISPVPPSVSTAMGPIQPPPPGVIPDMTKTYLAAAGLGKFPPIFPGLPQGPPGGPEAAAVDLLNQFSSPNLYRALHNRKQIGNPLAGVKFPDVTDPSVLGGMPSLLNFKKMFGADSKMAAAAADLAGLYPRDDNDNDSLADTRSPPPAHQGSGGNGGSSTPGPSDENGLSDSGASPMETDFGASTPAGTNASAADSKQTPASAASGGENSDSSGTQQPRQRGGSKPSAGRGSRLERMIAAEYKIMSEYAEQTGGDLPVMTPELMKSRRTHSLQLAIGEILHNRASVQSAATKYHIPRETLRRHYQRYLKTLGIPRPPPAPPSSGGGGGGGGNNSGNASGGSAPSSGAPTPTNTVRSAVPTNNNATKSVIPIPPASESGDESSNGYSSLMDIGQAYGIWNTDLDPELKSKMKDEAMRRAVAATTMSAVAAAAAAASGSGDDKEDKDKQLVIDEDDDNPGSPELDVGEEDDEYEAEENSITVDDDDKAKDEDGGDKQDKGHEGDEEKSTPTAPAPATAATESKNTSAMETVA